MTVLIDGKSVGTIKSVPVATALFDVFLGDQVISAPPTSEENPVPRAASLSAYCMILVLLEMSVANGIHAPSGHLLG